ncbi:hypothetical protein [Caballeronia sordidicola]|uniref:hypothetical protein n=1 Tax=Caballeronia sordidicola TaxID=196367 RepID=UPI001269CCB5|nr:hypothetical protein [Caballeronia sordidicola]
MDNIDASLFLSPNLQSIRKLVADTHSQMVKSVTVNKFDNFPTAQIYLKRYVDLCTFSGLKTLVEQSVKAAVLTVGSDGNYSLNTVSTAAAAASGGQNTPAAAAAAAAAASAATTGTVHAVQPTRDH